MGCIWSCWMLQVGVDEAGRHGEGASAEGIAYRRMGLKLMYTRMTHRSKLLRTSRLSLRLRDLRSRTSSRLPSVSSLSLLKMTESLY